jgi:hypothetical protein
MFFVIRWQIEGIGLQFGKVADNPKGAAASMQVLMKNLMSSTTSTILHHAQELSMHDVIHDAVHCSAK